MSASSPSSSSGSDSDGISTKRSPLKRKHQEAGTGRDSASSDEDESSSNRDTSKAHRKRKLGKVAKGDQASDEQDIEAVENAKPLSHKQLRRLKKKQKLADGAAGTPATTNVSKKAVGNKKSRDKKEKTDGKEVPKRQNSVWVGNLSFNTTSDTLRAFFDGVGQITRVHMPKKVVAKGEEKRAKEQNRGFAYVDFLTPESKTIAVTLSEKNLDGRRLLIKDGDDFTGRPAPAVGAQSGISASPDKSSAPSTMSGLSKTAQRILAAQKQPASPCLFLGNLGFETTKDSIRGMLEGHAKSLARIRAVKEKKGKKKTRVKRREERDDDLLDIQRTDGEDEEAEEDSGPSEVEIDVGIRKVRLGTFEDSGVCKGFAFVDFISTAHATAALINLRNHFLDGRKLVVEYASPDAVRRGGHPENRKKGNAKKGFISPQKLNSRDAEKGAVYEGADGPKGREDNIMHMVGDPDAEEKEHYTRPPFQKKGDREDSKSAKNRKRPAPGAALALAQREKVAIVPSEGTRLTFT